MSCVTISNWSATEMTDEMMETAAEKFVPMIMGVGASAVQMVRMGDLTMSVITHYADAEAAKKAQAKITEIRATAASDFPMKMDSNHNGEVFAIA